MCKELKVVFKQIKEMDNRIEKLQEIRENKIKDHTLIYFTDGEFCFDFETYGISTILCICNDYDKITVPKGKNIYITQD